MKEVHRRGKLIAFAIVIGVTGLATCVQSLPASSAIDNGPSEPSDASVEGRVTYDGAQLWRIPYDKQHERNAVADLQNTFGKFRKCNIGKQVPPQSTHIVGQVIYKNRRECVRKWTISDLNAHHLGPARAKSEYLF